MTARRPLALSEPAVICKTGHSVAVRLQQDALCENVSESGHHTGTGRTGISLCHPPPASRGPWAQSAVGYKPRRRWPRHTPRGPRWTWARGQAWQRVSRPWLGLRLPPRWRSWGGHSLWKAGRPGAQALAPFGSGSGRDVAPGAVSEGGCVWRGQEHGFALESAGWGLSTGASSWGRGGCGIPGQHTHSPGPP